MDAKIANIETELKSEMAKNQAELKHEIKENKVHPLLLEKSYSEHRYTTTGKGSEFVSEILNNVNIELCLIIFGLCFVCITCLQVAP